ncbi:MULTISPECIES: alcohol dehydrogenase catalytic domain-containing protein [Prauserella salsuginis group]|uniref:Alcohol dehydrogenase catalytic domain-containing protein n=1 Tax=Prauserella salsuginis TaxID=387889 RepID=A0ABW6G4U7_9PSEU|nr:MULTISPECIES: alcohol dehydrogenase catalytic domain-containing protein [Prauserella salsuginis group]
MSGGAMPLAATTTALRTVTVAPASPPRAGPDEALLEVDRVGICGTDLHIWDGSYATTLPVVQGHEISGTVAALPDAYAGMLSVGDRVAVEPVVACGSCYPCRIGRRNTCRSMDAVGVHRPGGFQERVAVPVGNCHAATGLDADVAALAETLSVSLRAVTRPDVRSGEQVVVLGAGPIGLGVVVAARDAGARILIADLHESRLDLARALGAEETVRGVDELPERVDAWTDGEGAPVVVEATGAAPVVERAFDVVATAGRISLVGVSEQAVGLNMRTFTAKELDVYGSRSTLDFPGAVALAERRQADVRSLISHTFGLDEVGDALAFAHDNPQSVVKAVIAIR